MILLFLASVAMAAEDAPVPYLPPLLPPEIEAQQKELLKRAQQPTPPLPPQKPSAAPIAPDAPANTGGFGNNEKRFIPLNRVGVVPKAKKAPLPEFHLSSPESEKRKKAEEESKGSNNNSDVMLEVFPDEEVTDEKNTTPTTHGITKDKGKNTVRARHGWPMDPRNGQVVVDEGTILRILGPREVLASASGQVVGIEDKGKAGWSLTLRHKDESHSTYAHLAQLKVDRGDKVRRRQVIGTTGNTGDGKGTYLDYSLLVDGANVNPLEVIYIPARIKKNLRTEAAR